MTHPQRDALAVIIDAAEELLREHAYRDHYAEGKADNDELRRAVAELRPMLDRATDAPEWEPPIGDMD